MPIGKLAQICRQIAGLGENLRESEEMRRLRAMKKEDEEQEVALEEELELDKEDSEDLRSNSNSSTSIDVNSSGSCTGRGGETTTTTSVVSSSSSQVPPQIRPKSSKSKKRKKKKKKKSDDLCDACSSKNAVWYCPADDAYLCDSCDQSVHSANAFSLRHERVSLQAEEATTEETKNPNPPVKNRAGLAATAAAAKDSPQDCKSSSILKRARCAEANYISAPICKSNKMIKLEASEETSGQQNLANQNQGSSSGVEGEGYEECEDLDQELHTVPVFEEETHEHSPASGIATDLGDAEEDLLEDADIDRFLNSDDIYCCDEDEEQDDHHEEEHKQNKGLIAAPAAATCDDLNEFLGGLCSDDLLDSEDARFDFAIRKNHARIPGFGGFIDGGDGDGFCPGKVKLEEEEHPQTHLQQHYNAEDFLKPCREEILGWNGHGQNHAIDSGNFERCFQQIQAQHQQRRICLRLDYEDVLNAWSDRRPFLTDSSAKIPARAMPEDSTSDVAGSSDVGVVPDLSRGSKSGQCVEQAGQVPVVSMMGDVDGANAAAAAGGGREARVTRYREKRRTRLFSKKIRYEVRKLNAERRPRLKGRFVKRSPGGGNL